MITAINNYNIQCRKPQVKFTAGKNKVKIPQETIDRFGLNMKSRVGYEGKPDFIPVPDTLEPRSVRDYLKMLEVNWKSHIDPSKPRRRFED